MKFIVTEDYAALSRTAADLFVAALISKPTPTVILATGNTPMGMYSELASRVQAGKLDVSRLRVFQLDAYLGLAPTDRRSLYRWMKDSFLDPLGVRPENVVRLPGDTSDPALACQQYEEAIQAAGGIDISVLGLGPNGHLGFNEPPADPDAPTRMIDLTEESIVSNARYWGGRDQVPRQALTAGMSVLLAARQTLLLVSGEHKREILRRVVEGPLTPDVPAAYLRQAAQVTIIADRAAWPDAVPD